MSIEAESDVEFDRMLADLAMSRVEHFAVAWHAGRRRFGGQSRLPHLYAVSGLAARYAKVYFAGDGAESVVEQRYWVAACEAAGLLHEAMLAGRDFEDVVAAADSAVAGLVSALTPDAREPKPKRAQLYGNRLGLASAAAQLVKLADLRHDLTVVQQLVGSGQGPTLRVELCDWLTEAREAVTGLGRISRDARFRSQWEALRVEVIRLDRLANRDFKE